MKLVDRHKKSIEVIFGSLEHLVLHLHHKNTGSLYLQNNRYEKFHSLLNPVLSHGTWNNNNDNNNNKSPRNDKYLAGHIKLCQHNFSCFESVVNIFMCLSESMCLHLHHFKKLHPSIFSQKTNRCNCVVKHQSTNDLCTSFQSHQRLAKHMHWIQFPISNFMLQRCRLSHSRHQKVSSALNKLSMILLTFWVCISGNLANHFQLGQFPPIAQRLQRIHLVCINSSTRKCRPSKVFASVITYSLSVLQGLEPFK